MPSQTRAPAAPTPGHALQTFLRQPRPVPPDPAGGRGRLQANGTGSWLMQQVLREAEGRTLRLNATRAAERLYGQLGFKIDRAVFQRQGSARLPEGSAEEGLELVRPFEDQDVPAVVELDARAFGARRETILRALLDRSSGCGLFRSGRLEAFALCREFGRGHVIGPVVAGNDADAIAVVASHVRSRPDGFTRLDTFAEGTRFACFLQACGLQVFDTVSGMSLADRPWVGSRGEGEPVTYALASHAFG